MDDALPPFEVLQHIADIGFTARGSSLAELFESSARAMLHIAADTSKVEIVGEHSVHLAAPDLESLLVDWLNEILYLFDSDEFVAAAYSFDELNETTLRATLHGEKRDPAKHPWELIVKAVTYHGLEVKQTDGAWRAKVILDV